MKFLLDVNISGTLGYYLIEMGHDVARVAESDPRMADDDILTWANRDQRIIITTDQDFEEKIWREQRPHCGVLRIENVPRTERKALLIYVLNCHSDELLAHAIIIALRRKIRIRKKAEGQRLLNSINSN